MPSRPGPLERDSRSWGISSPATLLLLVVPIVGGVVLAALRSHLPTFRFLTKEDGPIEWLQVLFFLGTAVFAAVAGLRLLRRAERVPGLLLLAFAAVCLFIAGEEIAWGQRLLGLETPEPLEDINDQDEVTVHNIGILLYVFNVGMLLVAAYGALAPLLVDRFRVPAWWRRHLVPPMALATCFGIAAFFRVVRLTVIRHSGFTITKWGEWTELCLAGAFLLFTFLVARRAADR